MQAGEPRKVVCLKRKALYRRVESYREGTVAMLKLERRRLARQPASQLVRQSQSLRARPFRASQCAVLQWPRYPTQQKRKEGSNAAAAVAAAAAGGGGGWRRRRLAAAAAGGGGGCWLLLQKRGPTSSLWRQVLAWLVVRPSQCCGKFQHF